MYLCIAGLTEPIIQQSRSQQRTFARTFSASGCSTAHPSLIVQVTQTSLSLVLIVAHNIATGSMKKVSKLMSQQALLAVDVVDQTVVSRHEPLLRAVAAEQFADQIFKVLRNHRTIVDDVLCLNKVAVVENRCELHAISLEICKEEPDQSIFVLNNSHAEADILHAHLTQLLQRAIPTLVAVLQTTNLVVGLLQTFDRDTNTDLRELLAQIYDTIGKETVCGDNDTVGLLVQFSHDILQVGADKRLAASDVCEVHFRQLLMVSMLISLPA